jgi:phosphoglycolate phosphatase-like HAD superfamily hydrolase
VSGFIYLINNDLKKVIEKKAALVFDFDGVLVDSVDIKGDGFSALYSDYGSDVQAAVVNYHKTNAGLPRREKIRMCHELYLQKQVSGTELDLLCNTFSDLVINRVIAAPEISGALEFLTKYTKSATAFVCSATPQEELETIVTKKGWKHYFARVSGSPRSKSHNIGSILEDFDIATETAIFFGDAIIDLNAAIECGIDFIGVNGNWIEREQDKCFLGSVKDFTPWV